jgi:photosystem II stability/assembly factor-like uncharacterized protein
LAAVVSTATLFAQGKPELLVSTKDHSLNTLVSAVKNVGVIDSKDRFSGLYFVKVKPGLDIERATATLLAEKQVQFVLPAASRTVDPTSLQSVRDHNQYLTAGETLSKKEPGDYYDSLEYFLSDRVSDDGRYHPEMFQKGRAQAELMPPARLNTGIEPMNPSGNWYYMGPDNRQVAFQKYNGVPPVSGRVNGIAVDPTNSNVIWVATSAGGVWKTTNGGANWTPFSDTWQSMTTTCVAIDPTNTNIVYVATGDFPGGLGYAFGIMKTTNGGSTWTNIGSAPFGTTAISKILIDPDNHNILLATTGSRVWRSTDAGLTWGAPASLPAALWSGASVGAKPASGPRIYWVVGDNQGANTYKSTDEGATWKSTPFITIFPTKGQKFDIAASGRTANAGPTTVYVLNMADQFVWRSKDSGATWANIGGGIPTDTSGGVSVNWGQKNYDYYIATIPNILTGGDCLFVGLVTLAGSSNASDASPSWSDLTDGDQGDTILHTDQHAFCPDPNNPLNVFFGSDGGIFRALYNPENNSAAVSSMSGMLGNATFYKIAPDPSSVNKVIGGTQDTGTAQSNGNLFLWLAPTGGDGGDVCVNPFTPNIQFSSSQFGQMYRTDDTWNSNSDISSGGGSGPKYVNFNGETCQFVVPMTLGTVGFPLYAGSTYLWGFHNGSWTADLGNTKLTSTGTIRSIATCATNQNVIYSGSSDGELWKSTDAGAHWKKIDKVYQSITGISVSPTTSADILMTLGNSGSHVFHCTDTTVANPVFTDITNNLPNVPASTICRDPNDAAHTWYVGNDAGVFMTSNSGATWLNLGKPYNLPNVIVDDLKMSPLGYLYAGTFGRGIWRIKIATVAFSSFALDSTVVGGNTAHGSVTMTAYAPAGGTSVSLSSSNIFAAPVPTSVKVLEGAATTSFTIASNLVTNDTNVTVTAAYKGVVKTSDIIVKAPVIGSITLSPATRIGGYSVTGTVNLTGKAAISRTVSLGSVSNLAQFPSTVVIPGGASSATFPITTTAVSVSTPITISASYLGTKSATLTLTPGGLTSILFKPNGFVGGNSRFCFVNLTGVVASDTTVLLSGGSGVVTPPASVVVTAGTSSGVYSQDTPVVTSPKTFTLTATLGNVSKSVVVTLLPAIKSLTITPGSVKGGLTASGKVVLNGSAGLGGIPVTLASNSASVVVPATLPIPNGSNQAFFTINTTGVASSTTATVTASLVGSSTTATLTVIPAALLSIVAAPNPVTAGSLVNITVNLDGPAPVGGTVVGVTTSDALIVPAPTTIKVPAGLRGATVQVKTGSTRGAAHITLTARIGTSRASVLTTVTVNP